MKDELANMVNDPTTEHIGDKANMTIALVNENFYDVSLVLFNAFHHMDEHFEDPEFPLSYTFVITQVVNLIRLWYFEIFQDICGHLTTLLKFMHMIRPFEVFNV